ncbi:hypothetical protein HDU91_005200 [Kappamyces sp. JEL0680]|nr:hypothetical protein HDU91_005200 [Kappamyces sp. JEL0680]
MLRFARPPKLMVELLAKTSVETPEFIANLDSLDATAKKSEMLRLMESFKVLIADGQEKVKLATETYDIVERHIRRLDDDLLKFEEEQMTGPKLVSSKPDQKYYSRESDYKPLPATTAANRPRRGTSDGG